MITEAELDSLGARPLTAWDRIKVVGIFAALPVLFFFQLAKLFDPSHPQHALHWRQKAVLACVHTLGMHASEKRINYAISHIRLTSDWIRAYAKRRSGTIVHREVEVPISAGAAPNPATEKPVPSPTLHFYTGPWLAGDGEAKEKSGGGGGKARRSQDGEGPVLVYAHGGGYLEPIQPHGHIRLARSMASACGARAVVFVAYTLCPEVQYPAHLVQIVESVRWLLQEEHIAPQDLVLAGDSAGGHMMAALLAHVAQPAPYVPPLTEALAGRPPFRAAVLMSPWFTWGGLADAGANPCDYVDGPASAELIGALRPQAEDIWCEIVEAPGARDLWARAFARTGRRRDALVGRLLVTSSDSEILYRDARLFAVEYAGATTVVMDSQEEEAELETIKSEARVFAVGQKETHVQPGLDELVAYRGGATWRAVQAFMSSI